MAALAEALQPAISDIEVSWHLPEGYDVIQTPQLLPFVQSNNRLVMYGILYRPPGEEKESPRTPSKRKMDWSMRSFSNSSVKVFWFEDECDLLSEDQLLMAADNENHQLSEDEFEKEKDEPKLVAQDSFGAEMEKVSEPDTIEAMADGLLRRVCKGCSEETASEVALSNPKLENGGSLESRDMSSDEKKIDSADMTADIANTKEMNNNTKYSGNFKPPSTPVKDDLSFEINFGGFFNDIRDDLTCIDNLQRDGDSQEHQRSPKLVRAHERDSGVGFSIEENDKSPDENKKTLAEMQPELEDEAKAWSRDSDSPAPAFEEYEHARKVAVHIYKNSEFLSQLGVPDDFGAVNIRGYVGEEEVEQVIPFPVNRSGGSSRRPTIHQLLARSLVRELQASLDSKSSETVEIIKRISQLSNIQSRYTALVARDQYCYDDQVLSALQFPLKENLPSLG